MSFYGFVYTQEDSQCLPNVPKTEKKMQKCITNNMTSLILRMTLWI